MDKWASRKLILTATVLFIIADIPLLYKWLGISETVTLFVITAIATSCGIYSAANVMDKKYEEPPK